MKTASTPSSECNVSLWAEIANKIEILFFDFVVGDSWENEVPFDQDPLDLCAKIMARALPSLSAEIQHTREITCLVDQEDPTVGWASTTPVGARIEIKISPPAGLYDLVLLAHEFSHALHIVCKGFQTAPDIWREVTAFVGEGLFLAALVQTGMIRQDQADGVRKSFDYQYLGPRNRRLQKSLMDPSVDDLRAIYPIARCCARQLIHTTTTQDLAAFFAGHAPSARRISQSALDLLDHRLEQIFETAAAPQIVLGQSVLRECTRPMHFHDGHKPTVHQITAQLGPSPGAQAPPPGDLTGGQISWPQILGDLGEMLHVFDASRYHANLGFHKFFRLEVLPPTQLRQFRIHRNGAGQPAGVITFAWLSDDILEDVLETGRTLSPHEWKTGPNVFINDIFVAPGESEAFFGGMRKTSFVRNIRQAYGVTRNVDGTKRKVRKIDLSRF